MSVGGEIQPDKSDRGILENPQYLAAAIVCLFLVAVASLNSVVARLQGDYAAWAFEVQQNLTIADVVGPQLSAIDMQTTQLQSASTNLQTIIGSIPQNAENAAVSN